MKRRNKTNAKKTRGRRAAALTRHRTSTSPGLPTKEAYEQLGRELEEAREQQSATADLLKVISRSSFNLQNVLDALLNSAARLCQADHSFIFLRQADGYRCASGSGEIPEWIEYLKQQAIRPGRGTIAARALLEAQTVHIPDVLADPEYTFLEAQKRGGYRTALSVPLLREGVAVGVMVLTRPTVRPFDAHQIALVTTFADQAVIAIENVRLFEAEQQRTRELRESLEQQTATSQVLEVISHSTFDLEAVFETVAENSIRLCGADRAFIFRFDGELLRMVTAYNAPPEFKEWVAQHPIRPGRHSGSARAALERRTIHIPDVRGDPEYTYGAKDAEEIRTVLGVPILKGDELLGVMMIYHLEGVRPFTDKQIALVETFADQAAIAIENARLLDDLNKMNRQLEQRVADQVGEIERMGRLRRFLPPQVADQVTSEAARCPLLAQADTAMSPYPREVLRLTVRCRRSQARCLGGSPSR